MKKSLTLVAATALVATSTASAFATEKAVQPSAADPFVSTQGDVAESSLGIGGAGAVAVGVLAVVLVAATIDASESSTTTP